MGSKQRHLKIFGFLMASSSSLVFGCENGESNLVIWQKLPYLESAMKNGTDGRHC